MRAGSPWTAVCQPGRGEGKAGGWKEEVRGREKGERGKGEGGSTHKSTLNQHGSNTDVYVPRTSSSPCCTHSPHQEQAYDIC